MLRTIAAAGAGAVLGYCMPRVDALAPVAEPVEDALRSLMPKPTLKLTYLDIEGQAEKVRLACVAGGLQFTDVRVKFADWPALKPKTKFGQLPLLEIDGETVAQSGAMLAYIGKLSGLYPSSPMAAIRVDEVLGLSDDLQNALRASIQIMHVEQLSASERAKAQKALRHDAAQKKIPAVLKGLEDMLEANGTGWFVGSKPTIADVTVLAQLRWLKRGILDGIPPTCVDSYPLLSAFFERASAVPEIRAWYDSAQAAS